MNDELKLLQRTEINLLDACHELLRTVDYLSGDPEDDRRVVRRPALMKLRLALNEYQAASQPIRVSEAA